MFRKLTHLSSFFLALSLFLTSAAEAVDPDLRGWWRLDEGSGTTVFDFSGNGNDGTLQNAPTWVAGKIGGALQLDGIDDFVQVPHDPTLCADNEVTVMAWINAKRYIGPTGDDWQGILAKGESPGRSYSLYTEVSGVLHFSTGNPFVGTLSTGRVPLNEWVHVCAMVIGGQHQYYINGQPAGTSGSGINMPGAADTAPVRIGTAADANRQLLGMIDDVRIYMRGLTQEEVQGAMAGEGLPQAFSPSPADGALHPDTWVTLSWKPGDFAVSHDVYLGDNFDDVNNGTGGTFRGNQAAPYYVAGFPGFAYPDGLVPGTTYYWRIDEVNNLNPDSPWKGEVWSFTVPSKKAYNPNPADGAEFVATDAKLSWTGGLGAKLHTVYFGNNSDTVSNAAGGLPQAATTYAPAALELGKTYYWRVDEFDAVTTHKGDVWSFTTRPVIPISDPDLAGWWKLDEGQGTTALDWSGHDHHGTLTGGPQWVTAYDGGGLQFDRLDDYVDTGYTTNLPKWTISCWVMSPDASSARTNTGPIHRESNYQINWDHTSATFRGAAALNVGGTWHAASFGPLDADTWYHLAATYDGETLNAYKNGVLITSNPAPSGDPNPETATLKFARHATAAQFFGGIIDDVRVYSKALTLEQIQQTMRGDPLLAWNARPANGSTPYIRDATPFSWSPGDKASQHDVYFGTDQAAVKRADTSTPDVYRGRQSATTYTPAENVAWGGGPYYWRIDEVNTDATISKGRVWTFTVADSVVVDDFERYDAGANQIWYSWHDGLGYGAPGSPPYFVGNGTGAAVGDENTASFTEQTIVHGGRQSMPLAYDNNKQSFAKYSEAELTLTGARDWTEEGLGELSIWFRGLPGSVGSFIEAPVGTYTITATGADIWNQADQFHYAFKMLTGVGTIEAQVLSVGNTDPWAKAGVMIRETLDAGSKFAAVYITPGNGCRFQARTDTGIAATSDTGVVTTQQTAIKAPYWVKLERDVAGNFRGYYSGNGATWTSMSWNPQNITMASNVYIGLALTSHNNNATCTAKFSNVRTTGTVSAQWAHQDIGIASNAAEPLYVAVSNSAGQPAVVVHADPAAATITTWTEWVIPLQTLANQGVTLKNVDRIAIGLGTRGNMTTPGGSGKMYFDDIRLYRPRTAP